MQVYRRHVELEQALRRCRLHPSGCVLRHVTRTSRAIVAAFDRALEPARLSGHQFNLMMTLALAGDLNVGTLADQLGMDPTTVPRVAAPLRRQRLIASAVGTDRRQRVLTVTARGRRRLAAALPLWEAQQRRVIAAMGATGWTDTRARLRALRAGAA
ncbi:MAG TPA: MarR family winged helix-turn-helix transcriptional regulator [Vicinamibacterales bacterium]|nr:MarR family winged helix-turn-helix transcriptional regulator [Vicinamibacterales bacterium]